MKDSLPRWDLTDLYAGIDSPELKNDIKTAQETSVIFCEKYKGNLASLSPDEFGMSIKEYEKISETMTNFYIYSYLLQSTNLKDAEILKFYQSIREKYTEIEKNTLFYGLEINKLSDEQLNEFQKSPVVKKYKSWLDSVLAKREYQKIEEIEKVLADKEITSSSAFIRLYDETLASLKFELNGEPLTKTEISNKTLDNDASVRLDAFKEMARVLGENKHIFTIVTNTLAKDKQIIDELRGYKKPITSRNISNQIEDEVVDCLVDTAVKNYRNIPHRYYKLKSDWLGVEKIHYADRNAPLPDIEERKYTWEEAKKIVIDAYSEFSPEFAAIGKKFFDNDWIDVPSYEGKQGGAYAMPCMPSKHPYLLLNFEGNLKDVYTLAHELGHGLHQYLAKEQGVLMFDSPITFAETASIFGEMLVFKHILKKEKDPKQRFAIIEDKVGSMINSVFRQIAFHNFETQVHNNRRKDGEISYDKLNEMWTKVQDDALGANVINDDATSNQWARIPHFIHTPFYVYGYAFGDCLVNSLYKAYEEGKVDKFSEKYMEMLAKGGTERHKELLAPFGLDATQGDFWQKGMDVVADMVSELEVLTVTLGMNKNKNKNKSINNVIKNSSQKCRTD